MRRTNLIITTLATAVTLTASTAYAQMGEGSPGAPPPSNAATASFRSASSGHGNGIGIGAVTMLNGTDGALVTWGTSGFHVDGIFGLRRYQHENGNDTTAFGLAARFWYHVHAASFADFSLGGGLGMVHYNTNPGRQGNDSRWDLTLQVGGQIRAFIVPNVAVLADVGIGAYFGPGDDILIGGQAIGGAGGQFLSGTLGIAYFFE